MIEKKKRFRVIGITSSLCLDAFSERLEAVFNELSQEQRTISVREHKDGVIVIGQGPGPEAEEDIQAKLEDLFGSLKPLSKATSAIVEKFEDYLLEPGNDPEQFKAHLKRVAPGVVASFSTSELTTASAEIKTRTDAHVTSAHPDGGECIGSTRNRILAGVLLEVAARAMQ